MSADYSLRWLLDPVTPETFFARHWETSVLHVERGRADYFAGLLSLDEVDRVTTTLGLHHPAVDVVDAARRGPPEAYTYPSGLIDAARLYQQFADGGTIILPQLDTRVPSLARLCRAMEREFSTRFQTNVYLTPANAQGFKAHYDSHDVFVLQVHGHKRWSIYDTAVQLPYRGQRFDPASTPPGRVTTEFDLHPGDVVYIPRGVMHDAHTRGSAASLHITLGALTTSWTDLLVESLALLGLREPAFRRALPVGFARPDFDRTAARETFRDLLRRLADEAEFDPALDHFAEDFVSTRHALLRGQLAQIARLEALSLDSRAGVRPDLIVQLRDDGDAITVACHGSTLRLPGHAAEALRFALATADFAVRELPGPLDDAGKLVLVRRLVREGLLELL